MLILDRSQSMAGSPIANLKSGAKAQGVSIYVIGLSGNVGIDEDALKEWASDPDSPTKGTATLLDSRTVQWRIAQLGVHQSEGAALEFTVEHVGPCSGLTEVNESVSYMDDDHNVVHFPSPKIRIDCDMSICPEGCPEPVDVTIDGCEDTVEYNVGELGLDSPGRILHLDVTLKNVCPHRRVALAAILNEVDDKGIEHKRGLKTITVPAHDRPECRDVTVRCIRFVLPEDLDVSDDPDSICNERRFKARFIAHYIDNDFECCCEVTI